MNGLVTFFLNQSLDDNLEVTKDFKTEESVKTVGLEAPDIDDIPSTEEETGVTTFIEKVQSSKMKIIDMLSSYCMHVSKLDSFRWSCELSRLFKDAYQIIRYSFYFLPL